MFFNRLQMFLHRCLIFFHETSMISDIIFMRSAGVYLVEVQIGTLKLTQVPIGQLLLTLRIGRNSTSHPVNIPQLVNEINLSTTLQINVDNTALQTQRCSITLTANHGGEKKILGIALISMPKDKNQLQNVYKLTQSEDKKAEIDVKIRINSLDIPVSTLGKTNTQKLPSESSIGKDSSIDGKKKEIDADAGNIVTKIYSNTQQKEATSGSSSNIRLKSKISEQISHQSSQERKNPKGFKIREEDKVIQTTESEIKRYRDEKQAYYQMYQIEKAKNQVAARFISTVIKKLTDKYPGLLPAEAELSDTRKKISQNANNNTQKVKSSKNASQPQDTAMISQLQQANRSLHRQVEEYKKLVQQLKGDIVKSTIKPNNDHLQPIKSTGNFLLPNLLTEFGLQKTSYRDKSNILPSVSMVTPSPTPVVSKKQSYQDLTSLADVDLKKWLQISIGQREKIQQFFGIMSAPQSVVEKPQLNVRKLRSSIDKAFSILLGQRNLTKDILLNHKQQINRIIDEASAY